MKCNSFYNTSLIRRLNFVKKSLTVIRSSIALSTLCKINRDITVGRPATSKMRRVRLKPRLSLEPHGASPIIFYRG
jgi:hypothetical protein